MSIRKKVWIALGVTALLIIALSFTLTRFSNEIESTNLVNTSKYQPMVYEVYQLQLAVIQIQQWLTDISATRGLDGLNDGFDEANKSYTAAKQILARLVTLDAEDTTAYQAMLPKLENFHAAGTRMAQAYIEKGPAGGNKLMANFDDAAESLSKSLDALVSSIQADAKASTDKQNLAIGRMESAAVWISIALLSALLLITFFIFKTILTPISNLSFMVRDLAHGEGDLTQRLDESSQDELGESCRLINQFIEKIQATVKSISAVAKQVSDATSQLTSIAETSRGDIDYQLQESELVATAMNEMLSTTQEVARNASNTASETIEVNSQAAQGSEKVESVVSEIFILTKEMDKAQRVVELLGDESNNIGSVLDVIKGISEQTNLLALNAAIEAARAGEQGRGFAVVADEVRTLAARTQKSTEEIQEMINRLQNSSADAVRVIDAGTKHAHVSMGAVEETKESLNAISNGIGSINEMNTQVATAAEEQSQVAAEIDRSITTIAESSRTNNKGMTVLHSTSEGLATSVQQLNSLVAQFKA